MKGYLNAQQKNDKAISDSVEALESNLVSKA